MRLTCSNCEHLGFQDWYICENNRTNVFEYFREYHDSITGGFIHEPETYFCDAHEYDEATVDWVLEESS